jgi:hypothetical protein
VTNVKPLQCGIPRSPILATAGMIFPFSKYFGIFLPKDVFLDAVDHYAVLGVSRAKTLSKNQIHWV